MKRSTTERLYEYTNRIEEKFKLLGNGAFASVYQHPNEKIVVKVFNSKQDVGYATYLKWALKNQNNRFVPKIYGVEKFKNKNKYEEITIVFMEKLSAAGNAGTDQLLEEFDANNIDARYLDEFGPAEWKDLAKHTKDPQVKQLAKFFSKKMPDGFDFDLHDENYMIRPSTGEIVITDPFA